MKRLYVIIIMIVVLLSACGKNETTAIVNDVNDEKVMETIVNDNGVSIARLNMILDAVRKMTDKTTDDVEVAFFGLQRQPYKDKNGVDTLIDTLWIYYKDGTFEQYANIGDEIVLFSNGTFKTKINNDLIIHVGDTITIKRDHKYNAKEGFVSYNSEHDYNIDEIGFIKVNISID